MNINRVVITGNLTRDPELRNFDSGGALCKLRIATNTRVKRDGEWTEKPNYFDVAIWGKQGENAAKYLEKGRSVAIDGRLEWREYTDRDDNKRQAVEIVADSVQFLGGGSRDENGSRTRHGSSDVTSEEDFAPDPTPTSASAEEDDIPFARPRYPDPFAERTTRPTRDVRSRRGAWTTAFM